MTPCRRLAADLERTREALALLTDPKQLEGRARRDRMQAAAGRLSDPGGVTITEMWPRNVG